MDLTEDFTPTYGVAETLEPQLRRIVAPNPSPMTNAGTNTYLLGERGIAVIDPGPEDRGHLEAILEALTPGQFVSHIFVTHAHLDHSPLSRALSAFTEAPVYAFGPADAGRSTAMKRLVEIGFEGGGEGVDTSFVPDRRLSDGDVIAGDGWTLRVIHTPGHMGNHICLGWGDCCFTADHVMGWASSLVSPPDGDLTDFMASCTMLKARNWRRFFPGHGQPIDTPNDRIDWLIAHRKARETAILDILDVAPATVAELARKIYTDTPELLLPAAERNVLAHLIDLSGRTRVRPVGRMAADASFETIPTGAE